MSFRSSPFMVSRTAQANRVSLFLQPITTITLDCIWCGKQGVHPVSKSQKTCGRQGCSERQNKYTDQFRKAVLQKRVSVIACGGIQPNALWPE